MVWAGALDEFEAALDVGGCTGRAVRFASAKVLVGTFTGATGAACFCVCGAEGWAATTFEFLKALGNG